MAQQYAENNNGEFVPGMPPMTEYVFSTTLTAVKKGAILVSEDSINEAKRIKAQRGKDIWLYGGASLTDAFMKEGLVDELWLSVHPILLGSGKPLFRGSDSRTKLTLLESKTYEFGLVSLRYSIDQ